MHPISQHCIVLEHEEDTTQFSFNHTDCGMTLFKYEILGNDKISVHSSCSSISHEYTNTLCTTLLEQCVGSDVYSHKWVTRKWLPKAHMLLTLRCRHGLIPTDLNYLKYSNKVVRFHTEASPKDLPQARRALLKGNMDFSVKKDTAHSK